MAITRRQFVTRLGALAAAVGMSQADLAKVTEAFAHEAPWGTKWYDKPKVIWVHGAECTGCSTSLLSLFEDARGTAIEGTTTTTLNALNLAVGGTATTDKVIATSTNHPFGHRTMNNASAATGMDPDGSALTTPYAVNIADVLIDFIALEYHETVMGMGGDLAYQWLNDARTTGSTTPFVMVVEGAIQPHAGGGYWNKTGGAAWCSIGESEDGTGEHRFDEVVADLAARPACVAIVAIGQCATFGGYPACVSPVLGAGQTGAMGTYDFLAAHGATGTKDKVINVPGCPTNPWWFVLTVVAWLVDATAALNGRTGPLNILDSSLGIKPGAVDRHRRLKAVYGSSVHGPACPRYQDYCNGVFAAKPGDPGCLQLIGCKGPATRSLCALHGWNGRQPHNDVAWDAGIAADTGTKGGFCVTAGHPCMGCTEKGYPDAFVPFVNR
jgi:hydrogenase small subunit